MSSPLRTLVARAPALQRNSPAHAPSTPPLSSSLTAAAPKEAPGAPLRSNTHQIDEKEEEEMKEAAEGRRLVFPELTAEEKAAKNHARLVAFIQGQVRRHYGVAIEPCRVPIPTHIDYNTIYQTMSLYMIRYFVTQKPIDAKSLGDASLLPALLLPSNIRAAAEQEEVLEQLLHFEASAKHVPHAPECVAVLGKRAVPPEHAATVFLFKCHCGQLVVQFHLVVKKTN